MNPAPPARASTVFGGRRIRPILVTGGAGFIGCNLADALAAAGHHVIVVENLSRGGTEHNIAWLTNRHPSRCSFVEGDVRDPASASVVEDATAVVHLAAQVAVTTSLAAPMEDLDVNLRGTVNLLEGARRCADPPPFLFASTNKVFGDLDDLDLMATETEYRPLNAEVREHGIGEERPLSFHTPYGCSKGAADQYVLDYGRTYGVPTAVFRMSCIFGPHQCGTEDQGWVAHFLISAMERRPIVVYGDGRQVRDLLYVDDAVSAYIGALRNFGQVTGQAFNLGGGPANAVSVLRVIREIEDLTGRRLDVSFADWRRGDQRYYVSNASRLRAKLDLAQPRAWKTGLSLLADWIADARTANAGHQQLQHVEERLA